MLTNKSLLTFFAIALLFFSLVAAVKAAEPDKTEVRAPIILQTAEIRNGSQGQILVKGLVTPADEVLIYINGNYIALANISEGNSNYSLFQFLSPLIEVAPGTTVLAVSRNIESGRLSAPAQSAINSIIENGLFSQEQPKEIIKPAASSIPAPVLITPNQNICQSNPYISGFSKNETLIKIYIDKKLFSKSWLSGKSSDKIFFNYTPRVTLERGQHSVCATAEDKSGNISPESNCLNFCVSDPQIISTSTINEESAKISTSSASKKNDSVSFFQKTENINSNKTGQKISLLFFILFIIIIIVWMIFVNKELVKENKEGVDSQKLPKQEAPE